MASKLPIDGNMSKVTDGPSTWPFEFMVMDILGPLQNMIKGNKYLVVITDRFPKLTKEIPSAKLTAMKIATISLEDWEMAIRFHPTD